jgi:hypothetical protein
MTFASRSGRDAFHELALASEGGTALVKFVFMMPNRARLFTIRLK